MKLVLAFLVASHAAAFAQSPVKVLKPSEVHPLKLSNEGAMQFEKDWALFNAVAEKLAAGMTEDDLSEEERRVWNNTDETMENYWDVVGGGCSWYCGGGPEDVTASSALTSQGSSTYDAGNAHDLSYKTAWVEGVPGYGTGEFLLYKFAPTSPRITDIIVVNGYVKSGKAYQDNARVKRLKVYFNSQPLAILELEDKPSKQVFKFEPIGNGDRGDAQKLSLQPAWTLKFEILEVYKGLKYDDVVITEIFFDGIDVH